MLQSAEEFVSLCESSVPGDFRKATQVEAPIEVWKIVIEEYPHLRKYVAHNKPIPIEILEILAADPDVDVRSEVANRRKLTLALFHQLALDPSLSVRASIVHNPKIPIEVLKVLRKDSDKWLRGEAQQRLNKRREPLLAIPSVWVFNGARSNFPSGVFTERTLAHQWISSNKLTGTLTCYPLNQGVYQWALECGFFEPKREDQRSPEFIGRFSDANQDHFHYEDGSCE